MKFISYAQNFEDVILWRALKTIKKGFYIDVGANHPVIDSVTKAFYDRDWHGINIEPIPSHYADLVNSRPRDINLQCAVGAGSGELEVWECDARGWGTASLEVISNHVNNGHSGVFHKVSLQPLRDICSKYVNSDIHFLKIDVEGFEKSVLDGMDFSKFRPWIVVIEATKPNSTEEVHHLWEESILNSNYQLAYADGLNRFYLASERSYLLIYLRHPPNVFDNFLLNAHQEAEAKGQQLAEQVKYLQQVNFHYWLQVQERDQQLAALQAKMSFRKIVLLRWLESQVRLLRQHGLKSRVKALARKLLQQLVQLLVARSRSRTSATSPTTNDSNGSDQSPSAPHDIEALTVAHSKPYCPRRQLLVDISSLVQKDHKTGIQRVVRSILREWLINPPENYRVEPIYATSTHGYRYAREFVNQFMGYETVGLADDPINLAPGDFFLGLDLNHHVTIFHRPFLKQLSSFGVDIAFVVYDLLPIKYPQFWEPQHMVHRIHAEWLHVVTGLGATVCISQTVADDLKEWIKVTPLLSVRKNCISWFHLGADIVNSIPTKGLPPNAIATIDRIKDHPSFLMVGTLEPRKGYTQVLDAFEQLWSTGVDANLVVVGKKGWMVEKLIVRLRSHSELNNRLFWLEEISDEYLEKLYGSSICLLAASYCEGFGLPLIEAAQHKLPIIARDIAIFREVAGEHAFYFHADKPSELAIVIDTWLDKFKKNLHPKSDNMRWSMWKESAAELLKVMSLNSLKT